jgi:DsbC/DsbD-like thiol-disulfide interchange protein
VNYGYEVDVLLPLTLRVPASAKPGTHAEIAGRVRYMICSELCVPARADVHLTLPIASSAAAATGAASSATTTLFAQTRARLPQPAPASWRAHATFASRQFDLTIDTGSSGSISGSAQFFPLIAGQINDAAAKPGQPAAHGLSFALPASDQLTAPPRTLKGIVVLSDTRAYTIDAPVTSPTR